MASASNNEVLVYLNEIVEATRSGSIKWTEANPSTYVWNSLQPPTPARIVVQKVDRPELRPASPLPRYITVTTYVFQAVEVRTGATRFSLNGADDESANTKLEELYEAIKVSIKRSGLEFLKGVLPPKHN